jgi:hypothetical protein
MKAKAYPSGVGFARGLTLNITPVLKLLPGTNTLAYYVPPSVTKKTSFQTFDTRCDERRVAEVGGNGSRQNTEGKVQSGKAPILTFILRYFLFLNF